VYPAALAPAAQTAARVGYESIIETFRHDSVVCEGLQFSGSVSAAASTGQDSI
jgi:hypothetical protein